MDNNIAQGGRIARIKSWFPDREFFMRSEGQVRFITISSRVQMTAAAIAVAVLFVWAVSMAVAGWAQYRAASDRLSLLDREAKVATSEERLAAYGDNLEEVSADLDRRMEFIEGVAELLPEEMKVDTAVSDSTGEAAATVEKVSAAFPQAAELARIEARQLAVVEGLTRYADWRAQRAADALKQLQLNPAQVIRSSRNQAMGGPLEGLATDADGSIDPRFERLGLSMARMAALEQALEGVPQFAPARKDLISSGFGYRRDPFNGRAAMHSGLDFKGATGTPIYAAAKGRVTFVGRKGGYGNTVEITHGNGLMTRYAHMSKFNAKVGQQVLPGQTIGAIGSTGRSTGPHLHFEVRINNRAVNPRTFLETAPHVLEEIRRAPELADAN
ncbi:peptidoglycan DD-metalloendopeptidase family protein [Erythrobacter gaetbuli]|uniref:Peptidoglycan DD-metalloendopeptidase family protein n=2 Tax=Qipengyuania gaetbuli TaxID=266952 RepID=A0A844Y345_9SPHN|nr:M23 family metallopeptidase [Qipengyuania gaetbuli]MXO51959.1 peptidoglycan DD-metalloendopeptidase family protein [Qipengyuania gaetbuli]